MRSLPVWLGLTTAAAATLENGGFESGNLLGWSLSVPTGVCSVDLPSIDLVPAGSVAVDSGGAEGSFFADLRAGSGYHLAGAPYVSPGQCYDTVLSQTLFLDAGDVLSGWAQFWNGDRFAQDSAWVKILNGTGGIISRPWYAVSGGPYGSACSWTLWQWQAPVDGIYTLELGATTQGDGLFPSRGLFDGINLTVVPEPGPAALLLFGGALLLLQTLRHRPCAPALRPARIQTSPRRARAPRSRSR